MPRTFAGLALALKLVTKTDLLRLKVLARLHARGLPLEVDWTDLLQESLARVLDGSSVCPEGVSLVTFLADVMRNIRTECCRRAGRTDAHLPQLAVELDLDARPDGEASDPTPDLERSLITVQRLNAVNCLFAEDPYALRIVEGLCEGCSPEQIHARYDMSETEYESARKRMRRALLREGLKWGGHDY